MSSMREQLVTALVATLTTPPGTVTAPAGLTIHREAMRPVEGDRLPAVVVYWLDCKPLDPNQVITEVSQARLLEYVLTIRVECRASGQPVDQVLDPLAQFVRLVIFNDPSLGGLAIGVREVALQLDAVSKDRVYGALAVDFDFHYYEEPVPLVDPAIGGTLIRVDYPTQIPPTPPNTPQTLTVTS